MGSKHKWTFSDFVTRVEELSNTPKKFCAVVFKTLLQEFDFYSNESSEYGIDILRDIFLPDGTVFENPLPEGLLQKLIGSGESSAADDEKSKVCIFFFPFFYYRTSHFGSNHFQIRDDQIQQIVENIESQKKPSTTPASFEEVFEKLQNFCQADLKLDKAIARLGFLYEFDCLGIQWVIRILTTSVKSKLKCSKSEMEEWFSEVQSNSMSRISTIIGEPQAPMLLVKTSSNINDYTDKASSYLLAQYFCVNEYVSDSQILW